MQWAYPVRRYRALCHMHHQTGERSDFSNGKVLPSTFAGHGVRLDLGINYSARSMALLETRPA